MPEIRRSKRTLPIDRVRELKHLAEKIDRDERAALSAKARALLAEREALVHAMQVLKAERERMGLSLAEVAERCGIDKANLSRLENDPRANPTIETLMRYAAALGRRLRIDLAA